ncbi:MAG: delta fatty acid desaturase [Amycolatopsis sp.]|nr:delta fatty acid desaturase [Amycolatopsis sp.]
MTTDNIVQPAPPAATGSDFARLCREITSAGLMARRPGYYVARIGIIAVLFAAAWAAFFLIGDSWWQLPIAAFLAVMFAQIALVSHDLAHRQVFRTRRPSQLAGWIAGNLGIGMSYGWWMDKHTRHHANPNHEDLDPDLNPDVLVWTDGQAKASRGIPRFIGRWQGYLFFPLLTLEGFNLHVSGFRALFSPSLKNRWIEGATLVVHVAAYLTAVFLVLSPGKAIVFILVHQCLWGIYMGSIFAPNHKGMPTLAGDDRPDFLRRQVLTSRNVNGNWLIDNAMGGLNYQIEHHLFPSMPSAYLRRAQPLVEAYCAELGVSYLTTGLIESWRQALQHLNHVGAPIRENA